MHGLENMCIIYFLWHINLRVQNKIVRAKTLSVWWYIYHNISFMFVGDWWRWSGGKRMPKILRNWTAFGGFKKKKTQRWWNLVWALPYFLSILVRFVSLATNLARYCFQAIRVVGICLPDSRIFTLEHVWKYGCNYFLKYFLFKNLLK